MTPSERKEIRDRYLKVDSSNVADVLDEMGLLDCGLSAEFTPYPANGGRLAGFAYTIRGESQSYPLGGDPDKMKACQGIGEDEVSVWSGDGTGICYFGELIAIGMKERGSVGALIDGGIRDVRWLGHHKFPVFARYRTPVQSIARWKVVSHQTPVQIRGATRSFVTVNPGDFVLGDEDGVIAIPQESILPVLKRAEELTEKEIQIRADISGGMSLADALKKYGHV
jgi:4-hydroxy-4-methyl-2-oxoglutarate aldolase